jgi:uncharacterized protein (TIGR02271 family)
MGVPEEDAEYFDREVRSGGILVTVTGSDRAEEAREILRGYGAELEAAPTSGRISSDVVNHGEGQQRLELREEELRAEKERVQAGEVRLHKEVVTEKKTIEVPVTREEVVVERHLVGDREASDRHIEEGEEIRIPVMEEEVRVEKTPVVKEEVSLKKRTVQDTKKVSDTVRREEAHVEKTGDAHVRGDTQESESWRGNERRYRRDAHYSGPERRVAGV